MMLNRASSAADSIGHQPRSVNMTTPIPIRSTMIDTTDLRRTFKTRTGRSKPSRAWTSTWARARSSASSDRTAPARRRRCGCSATLITPTAGEATVAGADLRRQPQLVRQRIGYVPQGGSTDPAETGRGELVLQGRLYGLSAADAKTRAAEILKALDLEAAADRGTGTYSGGMRRRLDVGLGIVHRPQVLFLDEPTTGLDPQARAADVGGDPGAADARHDGLPDDPLPRGGRRAVRSPRDHRPRQDRGRGHPDQLKQKVSGDVVTIGVNGSSASVLTLVEAMPFVREASLDEETGLVRLYVDQGETAVPHLLRSLDAAGLAPTSISLNKPSLDDVFLRQTGRSLREEAA
jgi:ABC-2 type transport system ATP-binding protein